MKTRRLGLDISAVILAASQRWGKYDLLEALNMHFSDVVFPGDQIIYNELRKMYNRRSYYPPRNKYTIYIEKIILEWLACGEMRPDPHWWVKTQAHYH